MVWEASCTTRERVSRPGCSAANQVHSLAWSGPQDCFPCAGAALGEGGSAPDCGLSITVVIKTPKEDLDQCSLNIC